MKRVHWRPDLRGFLIRALDVVAFRFAKARLIVRVTVHPPETEEIKRTHKAGEGKAPTPAGFNQDEADEGNACYRCKLGSRIE